MLPLMKVAALLVMGTLALVSEPRRTERSPQRKGVGLGWVVGQQGKRGKGRRALGPWG